ncbi:MAG: hypothetical protein ACFNKL_06930, partial [Treponema sp.]
IYISQLGAINNLLCNFALCKIAADGKPVMSFISSSPVRRTQFSSLENPPSLGTTKGLTPFGIPDYSYILIF